MSSFHYDLDLALKSPSINTKDDLTAESGTDIFHNLQKIIKFTRVGERYVTAI